MMIVGRDAAARAEKVGAAILARSERLIGAAGLGAFAETSIEILGSETSYGVTPAASPAREVILKVGVRHASRDALQIFARRDVLRPPPRWRRA